MPCPVDTTLQFAKICGSVQEICPVGDPQNLRVTIDLINPEGGALTDPTTDAFVVGGRIFDDLIVDSTDGCWCTCDLLVNTAADPAMSLQPNNTAYKITVRWGTTTVIDGLQFQLGADTIGNFTLDNNAECGDCINISDLVEIPVLPPAATFCDQVDACVTDLQTQADGNTAAIAALVDNDTTNVTATLAADATGLTVTITDSATNDVTSAPIPLVSADVDQIATIGTDGAVLVSCEAIQDCVGNALAAVDGIAYDDAANAITVNIVDANGDPLTPTADGTYQLPESDGCCVQTTLCDPNNGDAEVLALTTISNGAATGTLYLNPDFSVFAGDETALTTCDQGSALADCNGDELAAGERIITIDSAVAVGVALPYIFVDSGDGCTPAGRTGCIDQGGVTVNPFGRTYQSAPGSASWTAQGPTPGVWHASLDESAASWFPSTTGDPSNTEIVIVDRACMTLANPTCEDMTWTIWFGQHSELSVDRNFRITAEVQWEDTLGGWNQAIHHATAHDFQNFEGNVMDAWNGQSITRVVPANSSLDFCVRMIGLWQANLAANEANLDLRTNVGSPQIHLTAVGGFN